jgi:hypothetical protein
MINRHDNMGVTAKPPLLFQNQRVSAFMDDLSSSYLGPPDAGSMVCKFNALGNNHDLYISKESSLDGYPDYKKESYLSSDSRALLNDLTRDGTFKIHMSATHIVACNTEGQIGFHGLNSNGQFGNGTYETPTIGSFLQDMSSSLPGGRKVVDCAAGMGYTVIVCDDGTAWGCGDLSYGKTGTDSASGSTSTWRRVCIHPRYKIIRCDAVSPGCMTSGSAGSVANAMSAAKTYFESEDGSIFVSGRLATSSAFAVNNLSTSYNRYLPIKIFPRDGSWINTDMMVASDATYLYFYYNSSLFGDKTPLNTPYAFPGYFIRAGIPLVFRLGETGSTTITLPLEPVFTTSSATATVTDSSGNQSMLRVPMARITRNEVPDSSKIEISPGGSASLTKCYPMYIRLRSAQETNPNL